MQDINPFTAMDVFLPGKHSFKSSARAIIIIKLTQKNAPFGNSIPVGIQAGGHEETGKWEVICCAHRVMS